MYYETEKAKAYSVGAFVEYSKENARVLLEETKKNARLLGEDLSNLNVDNTDPNKVKDANFISFYKGAPVVYLPEDVFGSNGFSFGAIFLGEGNKEEKSKDFVDTLKHEYGHTIQLKVMGLEKYTTTVVAPSVLYHHFGEDLKDMGLNPFPDYYDAPWEHIADILGGVKRSNEDPRADSWSVIYVAAIAASSSFATDCNSLLL